MKCLLIETKDNRKFVTHEKNFIQLIEFSKAFNAQISTVKLEEGTVLELEELAPAICDPNYKKTKLQYEIIETKVLSAIKSRNEMLEVANKIKKYISDEFSNKKSVSLKNLKKEFKSYKLSDAALCNHIRRVKMEMERNGYKFHKIGVGEYQTQ
jgi:hypothetical protein